MKGPSTPVQPTLYRSSWSQGSHDQINVGNVERWLSLAGGGALIVGGLARGTIGGLGATLLGGCLVYRGATGHCEVYHALGAIRTNKSQPPATTIPAGQGVKVEVAVTIDRSAGELFRFWRDFKNLPRIMTHLRSVEPMGEKQSRWTASGPMGVSAHWDAEVYNERKDAMIAWRSLPGSEVATAGSVHFDAAPGGRGTVVRVNLKYDPPGGQAGAALAWLVGQDAEQQIRADLGRLSELFHMGASAELTHTSSGRH